MPVLVVATALAATVAVPSAAHAAAGDRTRITLKVSGCEGCSFRPYSVLQEAEGDQAYVTWKGKRVVVRNGIARFTIPTDYTDGMSLQPKTSWQSGSAGYVPMVTLSKKSYCWKGTPKAAATLKIVVKKKAEQGMGGPAIIPNAFLKSVGQPKSPPGHQDLPYCVVPQ
jgi:hypothetical protein